MCGLHLVHPTIGGELGPNSSLHHLSASVQDHLQERNHHCEQHPYVNHFNIRSDWEALGDSKKPNNIVTNYSESGKMYTYRVARTSSMVRLTWMTMSM